MTAYVSIGVQARHDVLLVPNAALRFKPSDPDKKPENAQKPRSPQRARWYGRHAAKAWAGGKGKKRDSQGGTVYVLADGEIKPVAVHGITDNRNTEIVGGELKVGDRVVTGETARATRAPRRSACGCSDDGSGHFALLAWQVLPNGGGAVPRA